MACQSLFRKVCTHSYKKLTVATLCVTVTFFCFLTVSQLHSRSDIRHLSFRHLLSPGPNSAGNLTSQPVRNKEKWLIYLCTFKHGCAGWSDRQRAFVGVYLLSQITDRRFGLMLTMPCDVRNFYMPNKYDWTVRPEDLEGRSQRIIDPSTNLSKIEDFNKMYPEDVLFATVYVEIFTRITANRHFKPRLPAWAHGRYPTYFHNAWDILMRPTPKLQRRLDLFLQSVNFHNRSKPLVGVHVRIGKNPSNPNEIRLFNNASSLGELWRKVTPYVKNGSQLFLASDSMEVRNMSRRMFAGSHHDTGGVILHVTKQRRDPRACQGFEDAILDQLILSYCDVLFRSRGGFSMRAAYMNRPKSKVYLLNQGKVRP